VAVTDRNRAYKLERNEPLGDGLRRIAAGRADSALKRLRGVAPGDEAFDDAVHGARKDLKKLRAVIRVLRDRLGAGAAADLNARFRDAGRALSERRDATVKLETLRRLSERFPELPERSLAAWREELTRERDAARAATDAMTLLESVELIEAGRERIEDWSLDGDSWELIDRGVRRTYRQGRRAMRRAESAASEESFHSWRKRAKDHWYLLRILRDAWPEVLEPNAESAHRLTEVLGDHHDLAVLRADLGARELVGDTEALSGAIVAYQTELGRPAFELGARLYAEKPRRFSARLRGYWEAWRE
jgi:CHAD domain-containing protein